MVLLIYFDEQPQILNTVRHLSSTGKIQDWILKFVLGDTTQKLTILSNKFEITSVIDSQVLYKILHLPASFLGLRAALTDMCQALQAPELCEACYKFIDNLVKGSKYLKSLREIGLNMALNFQTNSLPSYFSLLMGKCMC